MNKEKSQQAEPSKPVSHCKCGTPGCTGFYYPDCTSGPIGEGLGAELLLYPRSLSWVLRRRRAQYLQD